MKVKSDLNYYVRVIEQQVSHNCHSGVISSRDTDNITSSTMLELVYGVLVVLQSFSCCSAAFENRSAVDSETYNHSNQHLLQSQDNQRYTISRVDKTEFPYLLCLHNIHVWGMNPTPAHPGLTVMIRKDCVNTLISHLGQYHAMDLIT